MNINCTKFKWCPTYTFEILAFIIFVHRQREKQEAHESLINGLIINTFFFLSKLLYCIFQEEIAQQRSHLIPV